MIVTYILIQLRDDSYVLSSTMIAQSLSSANRTPSPKHRRMTHVRRTPAQRGSRKKENVSPPTTHQSPKQPTAANSSFHAPVKPKTKDSDSTLELYRQNIELCDDHIECKPVSKATVQMYAEMVGKAVGDGGITICAERPVLVFPWTAGFEIIDAYADNLGEWEGCCVCTVTDILLGPGALPLMVGLHVMGDYFVYQNCLDYMRLYLGEEEVNEMDELFIELARIHLKYIEQGDI